MNLRQKTTIYLGLACVLVLAYLFHQVTWGSLDSVQQLNVTVFGKRAAVSSDEIPELDMIPVLLPEQISDFSTARSVPRMALLLALPVTVDRIYLEHVSTAQDGTPLCGMTSNSEPPTYSGLDRRVFLETNRINVTEISTSFLEPLPPEGMWLLACDMDIGPQPISMTNEMIAVANEGGKVGQLPVRISFAGLKTDMSDLTLIRESGAKRYNDLFIDVKKNGLVAARWTGEAETNRRDMCLALLGTIAALTATLLLDVINQGVQALATRSKPLDELF